MGRRPKKYRVNRGPSARECLDAEICHLSREEQAWRERRQRFIAGLPPLEPGEVLALLEQPALVTTAILFHRLRKAVLSTPDGREMFDAFGRRWMQFYGSGRLPATWWDGWPPDLQIYGGK